MGILSKKQKQLIEYRIGASEDAFGAVNLLIEHKHYNAALNRLYIGLFHHLAAFLASRGDEASSIEDVFDKLRHWEGNELSYSDKDNIDQLEELAAEADPRPFYSVGLEVVEQKGTIAKRIISKLEKLIHQPVDFVPEILGLMKKHGVALEEDSDQPLPHSDKLIKFIDSQVLKSEKAHSAFLHFVKDISDLRSEGALEIILEQEIATLGHEKKDQLEELCSEAITELKGYDLPSYTSKIVTKKTGPTNGKQQKNIESTARDEEHKPEVKVSKNPRPVLVPWDFSELSTKALDHAINFAKTARTPICLLHIVKKQSEILPAEEKISTIIQQKTGDTGLVFDTVVKPGNIFTDISEEADNRRAQLVVMGTHGIKGMQKITGSWALKVIADTKAPFMVIQDKPKNDRIENIVFPVTHVRDIKKMLNEVQLLHELYQTTFHLVRLEKYPTESFKKQSVTNFVFVRSFMKHNGISYTENVVGGTKNYYEAALKHAKKTKADLVFVLTTKDINSLDYVMGADEQKVIANPDKMAVLCVNPKHAKAYSIGAVGSY